MYQNVNVNKTENSTVSFEIVFTTDSVLYFVYLKYTECFDIYLTPPGINYISRDGISTKIQIRNPCLSTILI